MLAACPGLCSVCSQPPLPPFASQALFLELRMRGTRHGRREVRVETKSMVRFTVFLPGVLGMEPTELHSSPGRNSFVGREQSPLPRILQARKNRNPTPHHTGHRVQNTPMPLWHHFVVCRPFSTFLCCPQTSSAARLLLQCLAALPGCGLPAGRT